jgi:hypothetical protein
MRHIVEPIRQQTDNVVCALVLRAVEQRRYEIVSAGEQMEFEADSGSERGPSISASAVPYPSDPFMPDWLIYRDLFQELTAQWRKGRNSLSSSAWDHVQNPAYQRIIGMGQTVVPFILHELKCELREGEPDDWFVALWAITGENPVPPESRGNMKEMAKAWLEWGSRLGYVNGEVVGGQVPAFGRLGMP